MREAIKKTIQFFCTCKNIECNFEQLNIFEVQHSTSSNVAKIERTDRRGEREKNKRTKLLEREKERERKEQEREGRGNEGVHLHTMTSHKDIRTRKAKIKNQEPTTGGTQEVKTGGERGTSKGQNIGDRKV